MLDNCNLSKHIIKLPWVHGVSLSPSARLHVICCTVYACINLWYLQLTDHMEHTHSSWNCGQAISLCKEKCPRLYSISKYLLTRWFISLPPGSSGSYQTCSAVWLQLHISKVNTNPWRELYPPDIIFNRFLSLILW